MATRAREAAPEARELSNYVGGRFEATGALFDDVTPVNGTVVARVHEADAALIDSAVNAARGAFEDAWRPLPVAERCALLHKVADGIEERFDDFLAAEVADTGKPAQVARQIDIPRGAANFRLFADLTKTAGTDFFEMDTPDGRGAFNYSVRAPHGVVGVIAPWNLPLLLLTWKVAPALASGEHGHRQAVRRDAGDGDPACRGDGRGRRTPRRVQRRPRLRAQFGRRMALSAPRDRCAHLHRRKQDRRGHHESRRRYSEAALVRAGRKECHRGLRRCGLRRGDRGHDTVGVRQLRSGLPLLRAGLRRAPHIRALRRRPEGAGRGARPGRSLGRRVHAGAAHFGRASSQGPQLLRSRQRRRREARDRRGRAGLRRRARRRLLRAADDLDGPRRQRALDAGGDLRSGLSHRAVRQRGRGHRPAPTTATTASPRQSGPAICRARTAWRGVSRQGFAGSIAGSSATSEPPSAASSSPGSAAKAVSTRSTSTPSRRTSVSSSKPVALTATTLPRPRFRYTPCVKAGPYYRFAGMIALDAETGALESGGPGAETARILDNLLAALPEIGLELDDMVSATIYTTLFDRFRRSTRLGRLCFQKAFVRRREPPSESRRCRSAPRSRSASSSTRRRSERAMACGARHGVSSTGVPGFRSSRRHGRVDRGKG